MTGFITTAGLKQLDNYKYKSGGYTWLDDRMNPYWEFVVKLVPESVAPNLITFIGWIFVILSYANILIHDYTFEKDIPSWCFFFAAACIFIYSTLDAIDGKQARRTKSSSPLGQLFDHGCDSFSISFFILAVCQAAKLSTTQIVVIFIASQTSFWTSNWMQYNTGILRTKVGQFGVTEGEFTCMFIHIITGVKGQSFWLGTMSSLIPSSLSSSYPFLDTIGQIRIGTVVVYFYSALLFGVSGYVFFSTLYNAPARSKVILQYFTFILIIIMEALWINFEIYDQYRGIVLTMFGLMESLIICKLIISSVTKMKFEYFHSEIIPLMISTIIMIGLSFKGTFQSQVIVFWITFLIDIGLILRFLSITIKQITDYLGIYCFSLQKKTPIKPKTE